jgi:hypothetical protein
MAEKTGQSKKTALVMAVMTAVAAVESDPTVKVVALCSIGIVGVIAHIVAEWKD